MTAAKQIVGALGGQWHGTYGTAKCPVHDDPQSQPFDTAGRDRCRREMLRGL